MVAPESLPFARSEANSLVVRAGRRARGSRGVDNPESFSAVWGGARVHERINLPGDRAITCRVAQNHGLIRSPSTTLPHCANKTAVKCFRTRRNAMTDARLSLPGWTASGLVDRIPHEVRHFTGVNMSEPVLRRSAPRHELCISKRIVLHRLDVGERLLFVFSRSTGVGPARVMDDIERQTASDRQHQRDSTPQQLRAIPD